MKEGNFENLHRFLFERLPKPPAPINGKACMAENWFIEDSKPIAPNWLNEDDLRRIWRVARLQRVGIEKGGGCPWLLLHQITDLLDTVFDFWSGLITEGSPLWDSIKNV